MSTFLRIACLATLLLWPAAAPAKGPAAPDVREDAGGWAIWQGGELLWRVGESVPDPCQPYGWRDDDWEIVQIASWTCPENNFTGGQLHTWDLNANGQLDLCYSNWRYTTYVYEAVGDDVFEQMHEYPNPVGSYYTKLVCLGDGDADDLAEMVFSTGTSGVPRDLFFIEPRQPGAYPDSVVLVLPEGNIGVNHMRTADLDGDGLREYIGTTQGTHSKLVSIWENRGNDSYTQVYAEHFGPPYAVSGELAVGDFDDDGHGDLVVLENSDASIIHVIESTGDDSYAEVWSTNAATENMYWVTPGPDLDQDGRGDFVVVGGAGSYPVTWSFLMYEAAGDNDYELVWSYTTSSAIIHGGAATGDINGDGRPELLCQVPDRTFVFQAAGDDSLELRWSMAGPVMGQGEHRIVADDLDGDGKGEAIWWTADNPGVLVVYEKTGDLTALPEDEYSLASASPLILRNHPNPFNPVTSFSITVPAPGEVRLEIFDVQGREIARLLDEPLPAGRYDVTWRAEDLASGIYCCRLQAGGEVVTRKVVLVR